MWNETRKTLNLARPKKHRVYNRRNIVIQIPGSKYSDFQDVLDERFRI